MPIVIIAMAKTGFPIIGRLCGRLLEMLARSIGAKRIFELGAAMALEVGKNRMESLGDVQETEHAHPKIPYARAPTRSAFDRRRTACRG